MKQPVPRRHRFSRQLRAMKVKGYLYFPGASADSIKTIACRLGRELARRYTTQKEESGVSCWRET